MRFLLVDKIHELEPGVRIAASKTLAASEELFQDHFPGFPVVPGVLLTEMMAQTAGKCLNAQAKPRGLAMLGKIVSAEFRGWVRPDQEINLYAEIKQNRPTFAIAECRAEVNGTKVASTELFFAFVPKGQFAENYRDEVLDSYLIAHPDLLRTAQ